MKTAAIAHMKHGEEHGEAAASGRREPAQTTCPRDPDERVVRARRHFDTILGWIDPSYRADP